MPEGPGKYNADYGNKDIHALLQELYPEVKISRGELYNLLSDLNQGMIGLAVEQAVRLHLPGAGYLSVMKYRPRLINEEGKLMKERLPLDYQACWKLWEEQYPKKTRAEIKEIPNKELRFLSNLHTDGYKMRFHWDKYSIPLRGKSGYMFVPTRDNSRWIKRAVDNGADFYEKTKV